MAIPLVTLTFPGGSLGRAQHPADGDAPRPSQRPDAMPDPEATALPGALDTGPEGLAQELASAMRCGQHAIAAQFVIQAEADGEFQRCSDVPQWLVAALGKLEAGKLLDALARSGCPACSRGYTVCEQCRGGGSSEQTRVCDRCAGLGVTPCEFCGGSGLIGSEVFPAALQPAVAIDRAARAVRHIARLTQDPLLRPETDGASRTPKRWKRLLLELEREFRGLGNALMVVEQTQKLRPGVRSRLARAVPAFVRAARKANLAIRVCLDALGKGARHDAAMAGAGSSSRTWAENRAAFYESLSRSDAFEGTGFDRTVLNRLIDKLAEPGLSRRSSAAPGHPQPGQPEPPATLIDKDLPTIEAALHEEPREAGESLAEHPKGSRSWASRLARRVIPKPAAGPDAGRSVGTAATRGNRVDNGSNNGALDYRSNTR
jgi:hypothetical protein